MVSRTIVGFLLLIASLCVQAQTSLQVHGASPSLYLEHKVQPKETWYSIGRLYNLSPKEIAPYNNTDLGQGLAIGQLVKIPLGAANFSQDGVKAADEVLVPVFHRVEEGEWMYRVSMRHQKVPIEQLEKWNNISRNQVKAGLNLIVGYLKVKKDQSALAGGAVSQPVVTPKAPVEPPKEVKPIISANDPTPPAGKPEPAPALKKEEPVMVSQNPASLDFKGGYFKQGYSASGKSAHGTGAIFRSISGWNDGKYYALMDNVPVGTIVLVSNTANNRSVYAKVLGSLSDIKENAGLAVRISNAAAAELGTGEGRFTTEVRY